MLRSLHSFAWPPQRNHLSFAEAFPPPLVSTLNLPVFCCPKKSLGLYVARAAGRGGSSSSRTHEDLSMSDDGRMFEFRGEDDEELGEEEDDDDEFSSRSGVGVAGREDDSNYDKDPEFADILGSCLDDPQKARSKMEDRLRKKRNKMLHAKTGSALPMQVKFNKFNFSNSYIWFEFNNALLEKDISLICDTIRSWHIVGRLGGCNSINMQLSQSPLDGRPTYDAVQGANVSPTTFYNIGDLEIQDNLARIWVDIGTSEPLLLDVLINALIQISSDFVGIKQLVFGGSEFESWKENLTSEDAGYSTHKI